MKKINIISPKIYISKIINELYDLNAVHIVKNSGEHISSGRSMENASELSETLVLVRSLISHLKIKGYSSSKTASPGNLKEVSEEVNRIQEKVAAKIDRIKENESILKSNSKKIKIIEELMPLKAKLSDLSGYRTLSVFVGHVKDPETLNRSLKKITEEYEMMSNKTLIALFVSSKFREQASETLSSQNFSELDISPVRDIRTEPKKSIFYLEKANRELLKKNELLRAQLDSLGGKTKSFLFAAEELLTSELEKAEIPLKFGSSPNIFTVSGWLPASKTDEAAQRISKAAEGNASIETSRPGHEDEVPVKLKNNKVSRPFEFLMNLYSLPKYSEIDPTLFLSITFPLFFGIILGDMGYGLVVGLLALFIRSKIPAAKSLASLMIPAAISSVIFGALFGEIFGFEELFGHHLPHVISRLKSVDQMLYASVAVGFLHVNIGLLAGFANEMSHGLKKALLAKGSWWVLQAGLALIAMSALGIAETSLLGYGVTALAVVLIYMGESMSGLTEIPGLFSNILSYSRLMAVGMASVGLAHVVNGFVLKFAEAGGVMTAAAVIIGLLGHALNIALGLLGGFLHSLRLHYVEFFTKFFKGDATPFDSFGKKIQQEVN